MAAVQLLLLKRLEGFRLAGLVHQGRQNGIVHSVSSPFIHEVRPLIIGLGYQV